MTFTNTEKELLRELVQKEKKQFEEEEKTIRPDFPDVLALEENYDEFLKKLLKKLE